jgi:hypothetical protein
MLNKSITSQNHDQYILIAALTAISYVAWVAYEPTPGWCATSRMGFAVIRIALVLSWLIYIAKFRAKNKIFSWQSFTFGALSGGLAFVPILVYVGFIYPRDDSLYPILQHFEPLVHLAPTATISGLYASFSPNRWSALLQGFYALVLQFLFFEIATLPISCAY